MTIQREIKGFADPDPEYSAKAREILARQSSPRSGGLESSVSPEVLQEAARMIDLRNKAYGSRALVTPKGMGVCLAYIGSKGYPLPENERMTPKELVDSFKRMRPQELIDYYVRVNQDLAKRIEGSQTS